MIFFLSDPLKEADYFFRSVEGSRVSGSPELGPSSLKNLIHWVPLTTSKMMQRKLFVLIGCSL